MAKHDKSVQAVESDDVEGHSMRGSFRPDEDTMFGNDVEAHSQPNEEAMFGDGARGTTKPPRRRPSLDEDDDVEGHGAVLQTGRPPHEHDR